MSKRKKIIIITDTYYPAIGGAENAILELAKTINSEYSVEIITSHKDNKISGLLKRTIFAKKFNTYKDCNNIIVKPLNTGFIGKLIMLPIVLWYIPLIKRVKAKQLFDFLSIFYSLAMKKNLRNLIRDSDLVISYSISFTAILIPSITIKLGIPLINAPIIHFGKWGDSPRQLKAYKRSNVILCPTNYFKTMLLDLYTDEISCKTIVIPHLISGKNNVFKMPDINLTPNNFILFIGRQEKHKGLPFLISAYKKSYSKLPLVIVGPGEKKENEENEENIIDIGEVSEPVKEWLLRNCRFIAVPSKDETFGLVYIEAMSHGKPSIALDLKPVNELLSHNKTALLSVSGDSSTLAKNIYKLSEDNDLLEKLSKNCLIEFEARFSQEHITESYFRVIKQAINSI